MNSPLTAGQRALLKAELESRKQRLDAHLAAHQQGQSRVDHARELLSADPEDAREHAMDREVDMAISDLDTQQLGAISRALARVDDADYGLCEDCGADIAFDRLKVEPHAACCIRCATAREQQQPRRN